MEKTKLKQCKLQFPGIYKPVVIEDRARYSVSFDTENFETSSWLSRQGVYPRGSHNLYTAKSNFAPLVTTLHNTVEEYRALADLFAICDARNLSRDRLFRDVIVDLTVESYAYDRFGYRGVGLSIDEITINVNDLIDNFYKYTNR